ncbi:MAG: hypothetical protein WCI00_01545 [bacterium]
MHPEKTKTKELGSDKSNLRASSGNFRACVILDSIIHQIGEDVPDRQAALILCAEYRGMDVKVQIFDDKGDYHIIDKQLKEV